MCKAKKGKPWRTDGQRSTSRPPTSLQPGFLRKETYLIGPPSPHPKRQTARPSNQRLGDANAEFSAQQRMTRTEREAWPGRCPSGHLGVYTGRPRARRSGPQTARGRGARAPPGPRGEKDSGRRRRAGKRARGRGEPGRDRSSREPTRLESLALQNNARRAEELYWPGAAGTRRTLLSPRR